MILTLTLVEEEGKLYCSSNQTNVQNKDSTSSRKSYLTEGTLVHDDRWIIGWSAKLVLLLTIWY
jgi:hypothetical protein